MRRRRTEISPTKVSVDILYTCPVKKKSVKATLENPDFGVLSGDCELCGSHTTVDVNVECKACKNSHTIELYSS